MWGVDKVLFKITRDTTIAGKKYHILSLGHGGGYNKTTNSSGTSSGFSSYPPTYTPFGRLRVDSNRVYFTQDKSVNSMNHVITPLGVEHLLYDFNLNTGAFIPGNALIDNFSVHSIDSVELSNGSFVKKYINTTPYAHSTTGDPNNYWIHGMGSSYGLLPNQYWSLYRWGPGPTSRGADISLCYENPAFSYKFELNNDLLSEYYFLENCFDMSHVGVVHVSKTRTLSFYPNPLTDHYLRVEGDNPESITEVTIYDVTGRIVYHFTKPFISGNNELHIPLDAGMYILKYKINNELFAVKIMRM